MPGAFSPSYRAYGQAQWYAATSPADAKMEDGLLEFVEARSVMDNYYMGSAGDEQIFTPTGFSRAVPYGKYAGEQDVTKEDYHDLSQALVGLLANGPPIVRLELSKKPAPLPWSTEARGDRKKGLRTYSIRWRLPRVSTTIEDKLLSWFKRKKIEKYESRGQRTSNDIPVYLHVTRDYSVPRLQAEDIKTRADAFVEHAPVAQCIAAPDRSLEEDLEKLDIIELVQRGGHGAGSQNERRVCSGHGRCSFVPPGRASLVARMQVPQSHGSLRMLCDCDPGYEGIYCEKRSAPLGFAALVPSWQSIVGRGRMEDSYWLAGSLNGKEHQASKYAFHRGVATLMAVVGGTDLAADPSTGRPLKGSSEVVKARLGTGLQLHRTAIRAREAMLADLAWSQDPSCSLIGMKAFIGDSVSDYDDDDSGEEEDSVAVVQRALREAMTSAAKAVASSKLDSASLMATRKILEGGDKARAMVGGIAGTLQASIEQANDQAARTFWQRCARKWSGQSGLSLFDPASSK